MISMELMMKIYFYYVKSRQYLLSHIVSNAVPSARRGLTSVFGMGTGMALSLNPPEKFILIVYVSIK